MMLISKHWLLDSATVSINGSRNLPSYAEGPEYYYMTTLIIFVNHMIGLFENKFVFLWLLLPCNVSSISNGGHTNIFSVDTE